MMDLFLDGGRPGLAGPYADNFTDVGDKDLAVADAARARRSGDRLDNGAEHTLDDIGRAFNVSFFGFCFVFFLVFCWGCHQKNSSLQQTAQALLPVRRRLYKAAR